MAPKIEIVTLTPLRAAVLFYYTVQTAPPGSADPARVPLGKKVLSVQSDLDALKAGTLIEVVGSLAFPKGSSRTARLKLIEDAWARGEARAVAEHQGRYRDVGLSWDGTGWT